MKAGALRNRVVIQSATETQNAYGEATITWADYATAWADIQPLRGREFWESQQIQSDVTHKVTLRYVSGITAKMRVLWGTRVLSIESVIDAGERNRMIELMCREGVLDT